MIFILNSQRTYSKRPEIDYAGGTSMQFKVGYFLFDTENTNLNHYYSKESNSLEVDSEKYIVKPQFIFTNAVRAEISYLRLKIDEMEENGFGFFNPLTFETTKSKLESLIKDYPEHTI